MSVLIRLIPFWIIGIAGAWLIPFEYLAAAKCFLFILILFLVLPLVMNFRKPGFERTANLSVILICFSVSFLVTALRYGNSIVPAGEEIWIRGRVMTVWKSDKLNRIKLKISGYNKNPAGNSGPEYLVLLAGKNISDLPECGRFIRVLSRIEIIPKKEHPADFPERLYYSGEGIRKKGWISKWYPDEEKRTYRVPLKLTASGVQEKLSSFLESGLGSGRSALILKAMLLGKKNDMPEELKDLFRKTGISHLLAVSGLHVGLIYLVFTRMFFFIRKKPWTIFTGLAALAAVWGYAFITGFGPSVQRAAGMISLFSLSRVTGRRVQPMQVLCVSFFIQSALNPVVIFQFGFQLSYVAVAGILMYYKSWTGLIRTKNKIMKKIWDFTGVSVSAQIFTLPFILLYFKEFPVYFIPGNLLLIPIGLLVFYLGAIYLLVLAAGASFSILAVLIDILTGIMVTIGEFIASLPISVIELHSFSSIHLAAYFALFIVIVTPWKIFIYRRMRMCLLILIFLSLFQFL